MWETGKREKIKGDRWISPLKWTWLWPLHVVCHTMFSLPTPPHPLHVSLGLPIPPLLHFTAWTPTEWKTAGLGTAQSTLCPILQWIPIYLSPLLFCPVCSLAPCPHLRCGCTAETKEKQHLWEHVSHPHMVLTAFPPFFWICFPTLLPGDTLVLWLVLLLTSKKCGDILQLHPQKLSGPLKNLIPLNEFSFSLLWTYKSMCVLLKQTNKPTNKQNKIVFTFIDIIIFPTGVLIPSVMIAISWLVTVPVTTFSTSSSVDWQGAAFWADKVRLHSIIHVKILSKFSLPLSYLSEWFMYRSRFTAV